MTLGGFIGAMLEPCETKGQAVLTSVCLLVLAAGLFAGAYPLYHMGNNARSDMADRREANSESSRPYRSRRNRDGLGQAMMIGFGGALVLGGLGALSLAGGVIVPVRSLFPKEFARREDEPR